MHTSTYVHPSVHAYKHAHAHSKKSTHAPHHTHTDTYACARARTHTHEERQENGMTKGCGSAAPCAGNAAQERGAVSSLRLGRCVVCMCACARLLPWLVCVRLLPSLVCVCVRVVRACSSSPPALPGRACLDGKGRQQPWRHSLASARRPSTPHTPASRAGAKKPPLLLSVRCVSRVYGRGGGRITRDTFPPRVVLALCLKFSHFGNNAPERCLNYY